MVFCTWSMHHTNSLANRHTVEPISVYILVTSRSDFYLCIKCTYTLALLQYKYMQLSIRCLFCVVLSVRQCFVVQIVGLAFLSRVLRVV